ncbi:MAG: tetratricopeptide repeat protein, partial [Verrucomicrobiota bacterium]
MEELISRWICLVLLLALPPSARSLDFTLPCLAPYLATVDEKAPRTLDEAFLNGPWEVPSFSDSVGEVQFPLVSVSEEAQDWFNQGMALYYGFRYRDAEACFRAALKLAPEHPMIYWGMALANEQQPRRAALFVHYAGKARSEFQTLHAVNERWLSLMTAFYEDTVTRAGAPASLLSAEERAQRNRVRIQELERMAFDFPEDVELPVMLLRQVVLDHLQNGTVVNSHYALDRLGEDIVERAPNHPAQVYRVLLWLARDPALAVPHAEKLVERIPGNPELWHLAGQLLVAAGRTEEGALSFEEAFQREWAFGNRHHRLPQENAALLTYVRSWTDALFAMGQRKRAEGVRQFLNRLPRTLDSSGEEEQVVVLSDSEKRINQHPESFAFTAGLILENFQSGNQREAFYHLDAAFRTKASKADPDLPMLQELGRVAHAMGYRDNEWRQQGRGGASLTSFEPERIASTSWALPDASGKKWSSESFAGKPLLLNFFLGAGCGYCRTQLEAFRPFIPSFE